MSGSDRQKRLKVVDVSSGAVAWEYLFSGFPYSCPVWSPDSPRLLFSADKDVRLRSEKAPEGCRRQQRCRRVGILVQRLSLLVPCLVARQHPVVIQRR